MSIKNMTARQAAFEVFMDDVWHTLPTDSPTGRLRKLYYAAWDARGRVDVEAVEGEQMPHDLSQCIERDTDDCSDCAYQQALDDVKNAIRVIDGGD